MLSDFIKLSKAISDETRVRILKLLENRELCVCQLMAILEMGQSTVSKHLGILKNAGLVEVRKDWTWSFYRLSQKIKNGYNFDFIKLINNSLSDDPLIRSDRKKLKEILKKDIKTICITGRNR
ncbi:MAG: metalloregulator ArsR/SmtB family transcription factor [Nitrospirota bacterium]